MVRGDGHDEAPGGEYRENTLRHQLRTPLPHRNGRGLYISYEHFDVSTRSEETVIRSSVAVFVRNPLTATF
jgi:hypothetical protein